MKHRNVASDRPRTRRWRRRVGMVVGCLLACGSAHTFALAQGNAPALSRQEFAETLDRIERRTSAADVRALLGAPDEIRTERDEVMKAGATEVWCYGTGSPQAFPTLGRVYFDQFGRVALVVGNGGSPPSPEVFAEAELRDHLSRIGRLPTLREHLLWPRWKSLPYNPRHLLQAANPLIELGEEKALKVIDEYLRLCSNEDDSRPRPIHGDGDRITLLLLCLYNPTADETSPPELGHRLWYLKRRSLNTPLQIVADVPFVELLPTGIGTTGVFPRLATTMEFYTYCKERRTFRTTPLRPPDDLTTILSSGDPPTDQLARLVETVVPLTPPDRRGDVAPSAPLDSVECRWDEASSMYVFLDGSSLPVKQIRRTQFRWTTVVEGRDMTIRVWRRDEAYVVVAIVYQTDDAAPSIDDPRIRLIDVDTGAVLDDEISLVMRSRLTGSNPEVRTQRDVEWIRGVRFRPLQLRAPARVRIEFVGDVRTFDVSKEFEI